MAETGTFASIASRIKLITDLAIIDQEAIYPSSGKGVNIGAVYTPTAASSKEIKSTLIQGASVDYLNGGDITTLPDATYKTLSDATISNNEENDSYIINFSPNDLNLNGHSAFAFKYTIQYTDGTSINDESYIYYELIELSAFGTNKHFSAVRFPVELMLADPDLIGNNITMILAKDNQYTEKIGNNFEPVTYLGEGSFEGPKPLIYETDADGNQVVDFEGNPVVDWDKTNAQEAPMIPSYKFEATAAENYISGFDLGAMDADMNLFPVNLSSNIINSDYNDMVTAAWNAWNQYAASDPGKVSIEIAQTDVTTVGSGSNIYITSTNWEPAFSDDGKGAYDQYIDNKYPNIPTMGSYIDPDESTGMFAIAKEHLWHKLYLSDLSTDKEYIELDGTTTDGEGSNLNNHYDYFRKRLPDAKIAVPSITLTDRDNVTVVNGVDTVELSKGSYPSLEIKPGYDKPNLTANTVLDTKITITCQNEEGEVIKTITDYNNGDLLTDPGLYTVNVLNTVSSKNPYRFMDIDNFETDPVTYQFNFIRPYIPPSLILPTISLRPQNDNSIFVDVKLLLDSEDRADNYKYSYTYSLNNNPVVSLDGKESSITNKNTLDETHTFKFTDKGSYNIYVKVSSDRFPVGQIVTGMFVIGNGKDERPGDSGTAGGIGEGAISIPDATPPDNFTKHDSYDSDTNGFYNDITFKSDDFNMKDEIHTITVFGKKYAINPYNTYPIFANSDIHLESYSASYPNKVDHIHTIGTDITGKEYNTYDEPTTVSKGTKFKPGGITINDNDLDITNKGSNTHFSLEFRDVVIDAVEETNKPATPTFTATSDHALAPWKIGDNKHPLTSTKEIVFTLNNTSPYYDCKCFIDGKEIASGSTFEQPGTHYFYAIYKDKHNYLVSYSEPQKFFIESEHRYSSPYIDYMPKKEISNFYDVTIDYFYYDHLLGLDAEEGQLDENGNPRVKAKLYKLNKNDPWQEYHGTFRITKSTTIYARKLYSNNYFFDSQLTITFNNFSYAPPERPEISDIGDPETNGGNLAVYIPTVYKRMGYSYKEKINGLPYRAGQPVTNYERNKKKFYYTVEVTNNLNLEKETFSKIFYIDTRAPKRPLMTGFTHGMISVMPPSTILTVSNREKGVSYTYVVNDKIAFTEKADQASYPIHRMKEFADGRYNKVYKIIVQAKREDNGMANTAYFYIDINYDTSMKAKDDTSTKAAPSEATGFNSLKHADRNILYPLLRENNYSNYPGELMLNNRTGDISIISNEVSDTTHSYKIVDVTENIMHMLRFSSNVLGDSFKMIPIYNEKVRWLEDSFEYIQDKDAWIRDTYNQIDKDIADLQQKLDQLDKDSAKNQEDIKTMKKVMYDQKHRILDKDGDFNIAFTELNGNIRRQLPILRAKYLDYLEQFRGIESIIAMICFNVQHIDTLANKKVTLNDFNNWTDKIVNNGIKQKNRFKSDVDGGWLDPANYGINMPAT